MDVVVHHLRPGGLPAAGHDGRARPRPRPAPAQPPGAARPDLGAEERAGRPRDVRGPRVERHRAHLRRRLRRVPAPAARGERDGLRRPDRQHGGRAAAVPGRRRALPPPVPARARRRVPGHQPRAVRARARARRPRRRRRRAGGARRRGRRRPVDLRIPRRDDPQHRGVRAGLSRRRHHPAGAELPVHADHPVGRQRRDLAQRVASREAAVDRRGRRRTDHGVRRRRRPRRGRLRGRRDRPALRRRGLHPGGRRGLLPDQRAVSCARGGLHPGRHALPGGRRHPVLRAA